MTVRVLPAPVAITSSALRWWSRLEGSRDPADGARLVVALDDARADYGVGQRAPLSRRWITQFQLRLLVKTLDRARRIGASSQIQCS